MVNLKRIYTKGGDYGETSLGNGTRLPKTSPRIAAYGGVDELNSVIGIALTADMPESIAGHLKHVQNNLFDMGADLCVPESANGSDGSRLRVTSQQVSDLEGWIDAANESLQPLDSFVLPGGSAAAAHLHHARAVCRRTEIAVHALAASETINPQVSIYLNRLSDLLFVWARVCNNSGIDDILWVPGRSQTSRDA